MIETQESTNDDLLIVKIIEEATEADLEAIKPVLKKHSVETGDPRLLLLLEGIENWGDVVGLWSDLNFDGDRVNAFSRIAIVGEASWKGWLTGTIESFVDIELKFFGRPELEHAQNWVQQ